MLILVAAAIAAGAVPLENHLVEADRALQAGRLDQARTMVTKAVAGGAVDGAVAPIIAELALREGRFSEALGRYSALSRAHPNEARYAERAALSALKLGELTAAATFIDRATMLPGASWRSWNAKGVLADYNRDWPSAEEAYRRATALDSERGEIINNRAWSLMLQGKWADGLPLLERAAELEPGLVRIQNNLELVRVALAEDLPKRLEGESDEAFAARLNDAGVVAGLHGQSAKATAAFSRALAVRRVWYARAARNLHSTQEPR